VEIVRASVASTMAAAVGAVYTGRSRSIVQSLLAEMSFKLAQRFASFASGI